MFHHFAKWFSNITGKPGTFFACIAIVVLWALSGPIFGFSDSWQLLTLEQPL